MEHSKPLSKAQLKVEIKRFIADLDRGISVNLFAELCGISKQHLDDVFKYENEPLTEHVQRRVNKGYADWKAGKVVVMRLGRKKWVGRVQFLLRSQSKMPPGGCPGINPSRAVHGGFYGS